jgi:c-di-GMP-binding flagellar brake protein YcgR
MTHERFDGRERRTYVRLKKSLPVRFKITGTHTNKIYSATTKNISHGGLCLEVHQNKEELTEKLSAKEHKLGIDIDALIPKQDRSVSAKPVWVDSRVDWAQKPDKKNPVLTVGLEFEDLSEENRKKIHDYLVDEFVKRYQEYN